MCLTAVVGITKMAQIQGRIEEITKVNNVEAKLATAMRLTVMDRMIALRNLALLADVAEMPAEVERVQKDAETYAESERKLRHMFSATGSTTAEENALLADAADQAAVARPVIGKAMDAGQAGKTAEATHVLIHELRPIQLRWLTALNKLIAIEEKLNEHAVADAENEYAHARTWIMAVATCALVIGGLAAWSITRGVTTPILEAVRIAETVAEGDLTSQFSVDRKDETGQLLAALRKMNASLTTIVGDVRTGTDMIASASTQIASGNLDLSARTEQQASSLEETASSMEELTSTVKQNTDNARQANVLAQNASNVARKGGEVVSQVVTTMAAINDSSRKIVEIISVIDGIAFQTNILALNAAVEAARAGEQGRGFAVVATEVRSLAQRSAAAAKEIKGLIDDSVNRVEDGSHLVSSAGATMEEIVASVQRVTDVIGEIAAASAEQAAGIEQIDVAITQMDEVTQNNASLVEEAAAAAQSLQDQAGNLSKLVSVFKIAGTVPAARQAASAVQAPSPLRTSARRLAMVNGGSWEAF